MSEDSTARLLSELRKTLNALPPQEGLKPQGDQITGLSLSSDGKKYEIKATSNLSRGTFTELGLEKSQFELLKADKYVREFAVDKDALDRVV